MKEALVWLFSIKTKGKKSVAVWHGYDGCLLLVVDKVGRTCLQASEVNIAHSSLHAHLFVFMKDSLNFLNTCTRS